MDHKLIDRILALSNLIDHTGLAYMETDRQQRVTSWNHGAQFLFGFSEDEAVGRPIFELIPVSREDILKCRKTSKVSCPEKMASGQPFPCDIFCTPIMDTKGNISGVAVLAKTILNHIENKEDSGRREQNLADVIAAAPVGIYHVDAQGMVTSANPELAWIMGYESVQALMEQITDFAGNVFSDNATAEEFLFAVHEAEEVVRMRCQLLRKDGSGVWALCYAKATKDSTGRMNGFDGFCVDISETIRMEQQLKNANEKLVQISMVDGLTKIFNRRKFDESLQMEWKRHFRSKKPLSVILCDIDFFKLYNDCYGHQAGDECLKQVAGAIQSCAGRSSDLAARYGGEEFVVILPETDDLGAMTVSEAIRKAVEGLEISHAESKVSPYVTLSLGVATLIPENETMWESIVTLSDSALYHAKDNGRNRIAGSGFKKP